MIKKIISRMKNIGKITYFEYLVLQIPIEARKKQCYNNYRKKRIGR